MAQWTVRPRFKKCIEEREEWTKDDSMIIRKVGWRFGAWNVTTSDDNTPELTFGELPDGDGRRDTINITSAHGGNIEDVDLEETFDGVYTEVNYPEDMDEDEQERLDELWEEDMDDGWENDGWDRSDCDTYIWGDIEILKDHKLVKVIRADEDGNVLDVTDEYADEEEA